jgi:hypothetical protein
LVKKKTEPVVPQRESALERGAPEVIVDFVFRQGELHVAVANVGAVPAHDISVKFDKPFHGLGGKCEVSSLALFRRLLFLPPGKSIETFLDMSTAYFARREPTRITAQVSYRDSERRSYERRIAHDLSVYKDVTYVIRHAAPATPASPPATSRSAASALWETKYGSEKR